MATDEEIILLKIQAEVDAAEDVDRLVKMIKGGQRDALQMSETIDAVGREIKKMSNEWHVSYAILGKVLISTGELTGQQKMLVSEAVKYAGVLSKIEASQSRMSQKVAEIEVTRAGAVFEQMKAQRELEAERVQERKLALENAEVQALKKQFLELENIARLDAQALKVAQQKNRTEAMEVGGDKARLAVQRLKEAESGLFNVSAPLTEKQKQLGKALADLDAPAKRAGQGLLSFGNFMRTAFGTLTAIGIFTVLTTIQNFFTGTLKAASQFRSEMAELNLAESILSQKGMDITRKELEDLIKDVEGKAKYLSTLNATKVVADTAGAVQEFDVTKEQLADLADAIAFIQVKNKLLGREEADAAHIINAAMDARSNFFNGMGINITEAIVKEKAYAMGLVTTGQELDKATRFQAILALLTEQTADKQDELNRQLENTPLGNQLSLQKEWEDAQLRIGQSLITVRDNLIGMLNSFSPELAESIVTFFINASSRANEFIDELEEIIGAVGILNDALTVLTASDSSSGGFLGWLTSVGKIIQEAFIFPFRAAISLIQGLTAVIVAPLAGIVTTALEIVSGVSVQQAFEDGGKALGEAYARGFSIAAETIGKSGLFKNFPTKGKSDSVQPSRGRTDTPTGLPDGISNEINEDQQKLQDALEKMNDAIIDEQIKFGHEMEDITIDYERKRYDITLEYARKRADAETDYRNKIRDINSDYSNEINDINQQQAEAAQSARNDELEAEAEFQNKMLELKENYLMDLEDALHERDARAVLRLVKQYNLDKTQAERERALERDNSARDLAEANAKFARQRAEANRERQAKLAEARLEYQDRLKELAEQEKREREDAERQYQQKMQDLEREMRNRLAIVAANLVQEFNLTKDGLDAILALYRKYYTEIGKIYSAMNTALAGQMKLTGSTVFTVPNKSKPSNKSGGNKVRSGMAEGGTIIADRPTPVVFGEKGLESATFTPLNRTGRDVNKLFSSLSGGQPDSNGGDLALEVMLSPDLEARIVKNTLNKTAATISRVQNSKVR